jgi:hypothetical protein
MYVLEQPIIVQWIEHLLETGLTEFTCIQRTTSRTIAFVQTMEVGDPASHTNEFRIDPQTPSLVHDHHHIRGRDVRTVACIQLAVGADHRDL